LQGLEFFQISSGRVTLEIEVKSYGTYERFVQLKEVPEDQGVPGPQKPEDPWWVEVRAFDAQGNPQVGLPPKGGYWELILPARLFAQPPCELNLRWIDFYR
jgi:hypothetical protein